MTDIKDTLKAFYIYEWLYAGLSSKYETVSDISASLSVAHFRIATELQNLCSVLLKKLEEIYENWLRSHVKGASLEAIKHVPTGTESYRIHLDRASGTYKFSTAIKTFDLTEIIKRKAQEYFDADLKASEEDPAAHLNKYLNRREVTVKEILSEKGMSLPDLVSVLCEGYVFKSNDKKRKFEPIPIFEQERAVVKSKVDNLMQAIVIPAIEHVVGNLDLFDTKKIVSETFKNFFCDLSEAAGSQQTRIETILKVRQTYLDVFKSGTFDLNVLGGRIAAISILLNTCHNHGEMGQHLGVSSRFLTLLSNLGSKLPINPTEDQLIKAANNVKFIMDTVEDNIEHFQGIDLA